MKNSYFQLKNRVREPLAPEKTGLTSDQHVGKKHEKMLCLSFVKKKNCFMGIFKSLPLNNLVIVPFPIISVYFNYQLCWLRVYNLHKKLNYFSCNFFVYYPISFSLLFRNTVSVNSSTFSVVLVNCLTDN